MFTYVLLAVIVLVLASIVGHWIIFGPGCNRLFGSDRRDKYLDCLRLPVMFVLFLLPEQKYNLLGTLRKLAYILAFISVIILAVTGFWSRVFGGEQISGYFLMIHATFGPVFAACAAFLAVFSAEVCVFDKRDWRVFSSFFTRRQNNTSDSQLPEPLAILQKVLFWLVLILSLTVIVSIVSSMFNFAGTAGQNFLLSLHKYCSIALVAAAALHCYATAVTKARREIGEQISEM